MRHDLFSVAASLIFVATAVALVVTLRRINNRERRDNRYHRYFMQEITHIVVSASQAHQLHDVVQLGVLERRLKALKFELPTMEVPRHVKGKIPQPPPAARLGHGDSVRPPHPGPSRR